MDERLPAWLDAAEGDDDTFVETAFRTGLRYGERGPAASLRRMRGIPRSG